MTTLEVLITFFGSGFFLTLLAMFYRLGSNQTKIDLKFESIQLKFDSLEKKIDKLDNGISKLENDMIEVKTILRFQECCMIKDDRKLTKAE